MNKNKDINFEINLLPVISLLAVLICFLLLTTAWIHIGSIDVQQAIGGQAFDAKAEKQPALWATVSPKGIYVTLKFAGDVSKNLRIKNFKGKRAFEKFEAYVGTIKEQQPNMKTALISPSRTTAYKDMIKIMDNVRAHNFTDVGINPL